jgi:hypothetical protein
MENRQGDVDSSKVPCVVAKRKTDVVPVPPEEVPEVVRLGAERVVYAFCKAAGVIV